MSPSNGLGPGSTKQAALATIAGSGHARSCYAVAAERGYVTREHAVTRALLILRFFWDSDQSEAPDATG